jgi:hypothetical protein
MNNWCICWFFHAYINEMYGLRSKSCSKIPVGERFADGFSSGVKGLITGFCDPWIYCLFICELFDNTSSLPSTAFFHTLSCLLFTLCHIVRHCGAMWATDSYVSCWQRCELLTALWATDSLLRYWQRFELLTALWATDSLVSYWQPCLLI